MGVHVKFDEKAFRRNLEKAVKDKTVTTLNDRLYKVTCPHCNREFETRPGSHSCPYCGQIVNLKLNINF